MTISTKAEFEHFICSNWNEVNTHIDQMSKDLPSLIYTSVDIREGKSKFAPVDCNIYPAGFNNLCLFDLAVASDRLRKAISELGDAKTVAIIPEGHTKNLFYLDHLFALRSAILQGGHEVYIGLPDDSFFEGTTKLDLTTKSEHALTIHHLKFENGEAKLADGTIIDALILNNDQSSPLNVKWDEVKTPIAPSPQMGWFRREKIEHFCQYDQVAKEFCKHFDIDPHLIMADFETVDEVDFATKEGLDAIGDKVDHLLSRIGNDKAVYVKASQGTYGMGISVVNSGDEVRNMNRKGRNKMDIGKNKIKFTSVLLQEGVDTVIKYDDGPAEITIYLVEGRSVGGFMRANPLKDEKGNLNSRGMVYQKFCISEIREDTDHKAKEAAYSVIARLSTVAARKELQELS